MGRWELELCPDDTGAAAAAVFFARNLDSYHTSWKDVNHTQTCIAGTHTRTQAVGSWLHIKCNEWLHMSWERRRHYRPPIMILGSSIYLSLWVISNYKEENMRSIKGWRDTGGGGEHKVK